MLRSALLRPIVAVAAILVFSAGCICLPGGGTGPGTTTTTTTGCVNPSTVTLGTPVTICLPNLDSRVSLTFSPALTADTVVNITCSSGTSELEVKTSNLDNYTCSGFNGDTVTQRTITAATNTVEFGVDPYYPSPATAPGTATITITADTSGA